MFDDAWLENTSIYKELVKRGEIIGRAQGIKASIEVVVQIRFPDLLDLARERVAHIQDEEQLRQIHATLVIVDNEHQVHRFLMTLQSEQNIR